MNNNSRSPETTSRTCAAQVTPSSSALINFAKPRELKLIASRHLMTNLELLQTWSMATPRAIFPKRKIGRLAGGFEASFLVLEGDPLANAERLENITLRVKQGHSLVPRDTKLPPFGI